MEDRSDRGDEGASEAGAEGVVENEAETVGDVMVKGGLL